MVGIRDIIIPGDKDTEVYKGVTARGPLRWPRPLETLSWFNFLDRNKPPASLPSDPSPRVGPLDQLLDIFQDIISPIALKRHQAPGNSPVVQWLGLFAFTAESTGSIPSQRTKIPHATRCGQNKTKKSTKFPGPLCPLLFHHTFYIQTQVPGS